MPYRATLMQKNAYFVSSARKWILTWQRAFEIIIRVCEFKKPTYQILTYDKLINSKYGIQFSGQKFKITACTADWTVLNKIRLIRKQIPFCFTLSSSVILKSQEYPIFKAVVTILLHLSGLRIIHQNKARLYGYTPYKQLNFCSFWVHKKVSNKYHNKTYGIFLRSQSLITRKPLKKL